MIGQALVAGGGKGTRLGFLARKYGNKSLVPINDQPTLLYTIDWLLKAGVRNVVITVNYEKEYRKIQKLFKNNSRIDVVRNYYKKTSSQCVVASKNLLDKRFLFIYGHAPAPSSHIIKLFKSSGENVAVSLYDSTTQGIPKPVVVEKDGSINISGEGNAYVEPPYILNREFIDIIKKAISWKKSFELYPDDIIGVKSNHPPEFHSRKDFKKFESFMKQF